MCGGFGGGPLIPYPSPTTPAHFNLSLPFKYLRTPNILIHFFFASFLHLFNGHLLSSESERSVGLKSSKTQILSREKKERTKSSSISLKDFFPTNSKLTAGTGVWDAEGQE